MKFLFFAAVCVALIGCSSISVHSRDSVRREVGIIVKEEHHVERFERRLEKLGATFEIGSSPGGKIALIPLRAEPDYLPPRRLRVEYRVSSRGEVEYVRAHDVEFSAVAQKA